MKAKVAETMEYPQFLAAKVNSDAPAILYLVFELLTFLRFVLPDTQMIDESEFALQIFWVSLRTSALPSGSILPRR
jgi:hypothetical protein